MKESTGGTIVARNDIGNIVDEPQHARFWQWYTKKTPQLSNPNRIQCIYTDEIKKVDGQEKRKTPCEKRCLTDLFWRIIHSLVITSVSIDIK